MRMFVVILYALSFLAFGVFSYAFIDPNLIYLENIYSDFVFEHRGITTMVYVIIISILFLCYTFLLYFVRKKMIADQHIFYLIGAITFILLFSYPAILSHDIFNYIATAKTTFFYGENPYIIMPIEFTSDPLLFFTRAANKTALYGPFWIGLSGIPFALGFGKFILILINFKIFISIFYILTTLILWRISRNIMTVAIFSLNPLVVIEVLVSSHNDIVMMFLALCSLSFLFANKKSLGVLLLTLSIFIKFATAFLMPVYVYIIWMKFKNRKISKDKIYIISLVSMSVILLLSPLREEMYPWYAVWILPFIALLSKKRFLLSIAIAFSFGLMLRYVPFMLIGTYFGPTPLIRIIVTAVPVLLVVIYYGVKKYA